MNFKYFVSLLCLFLLLASSTLLADSSLEQVKIGVLAKRGSERAMEKWGLTAQYLTKEIPGSHFVIVPLDFEGVHTCVINGEIDFLITNSGYYVLLEENHGLSRIATMRNRWHHNGYQIFGSVIFTQADNHSINEFKDLKNKIFMAVDPKSFGGWLMARFAFHKAGIKPETYFKTLDFAGTHDKVVFAVRDKIVNAGTVRTDTLERMAAEGKINLQDFKILEPKPKNNTFPFFRSTDLYPEWPFAKLSHTSNELAEQVTIVLLNMPSQSPAAIASRITGWTVPLDYRPVDKLMKELEIGRYQDLKKITLIDIIRQYWKWIIISLLLISAIISASLYVIILNKNLRVTRSELEKTNDKLESKVTKRTAELMKSERKYRIVADNTYDWELWKNPKGEFVYCSPSCKTITGYDQSSFIQNPELMLSIVHPDDSQMLKTHQKLEKAQKTTQKIEFRIVDASGNQRWIEHICKPIFDQDEYLGWRASNRDITSKKITELRLREQLEFERLLSELSAEFVNLPVDKLDSEIEKWLLRLVKFFKIDRAALVLIQEDNDRLITTHSAGVGGKPLLKPIEIDQELPWLSEQIKNGAALAFNNLPNDLPKEAAADRPFIVRKGLLSNFITPLKAEGILIGSIALSSFSKNVNWSKELVARLRLAGEVFANAIIRQMNAEKNKSLQEQLRQTQKMEAIGTLAGGIAHDFNNILFSIFGFTELAQIGLEKGKDVKAHLEKVIGAGLRAKDLVDHLLTFSRKTMITREPMLLLPLIKESVKFIRASLPTTIKIKKNIKSVSSRVKADPTQIHQVLMNLFTNAGHAMKKHGGILTVGFEECTVESADQALFKGIKKGVYNKISVSDTGYGMSKEIKDKIFDPFFTTKKTGEGTGMGLSTVHGIIKDMSGAITVYSEEGKGTTFHVLLPVHAGNAHRIPDEEFEPHRGRGTILIVDDEENILLLTKGLLEGLGYTVIVTKGGVQALERFKQESENFDLVITDLIMPDMTGLDLAKHLKRVHPDIPIILCTGFSDQLNKDDLVQAGISSMVMKPILLKDLARTIENILDK